MMSRFSTQTAASFATCTLVILLLGNGCAPPPNPLKGTIVEPGIQVPSVALTDHRGTAFDLQATGKVTLLFFGFTHCPDVCPASLNNWKVVHDTLSEQERQRVRFAFVTVDAERDDPKKLAEHLALFSASFHGIIPTPEAFATLKETFGVFANREALGEGEEGYLVDHTGSIFLIDADGMYSVLHSFGSQPEQIVHDVRVLINR